MNQGRDDNVLTEGSTRNPRHYLNILSHFAFGALIYQSCHFLSIAIEHERVNKIRIIES